MNVCTKFVDVQLGALYVNYADCDPDCSRSTDAGFLQHRVLERYSSKARIAAEYRVLRHIVYPLRDRCVIGLLLRFALITFIHHKGRT